MLITRSEKRQSELDAAPAGGGREAVMIATIRTETRQPEDGTFTPGEQDGWIVTNSTGTPPVWRTRGGGWRQIEEAATMPMATARSRAEHPAEGNDSATTQPTAAPQVWRIRGGGWREAEGGAEAARPATEGNVSVTAAPLEVGTTSTLLVERVVFSAPPERASITFSLSERERGEV